MPSKSHEELVAERNEQRRRLKESRREEGLCISCGEPNSNKSFLNCPTCRKKASEIKKAQYLKNPERIKENNKKYKSNTISIRKANGLCADCGKPASENRKFCEECLEKKRINSRQERLFRKRNNLCLYCGKESVYLNDSFCEVCEQKQKENQRRSVEKNREHNRVKAIEIRNSRREQGLCTRCGKHKASSNRSLCEWCLAKARNNYSKNKNDISRSERSSYGLCYFCGLPLDREGKTCSNCADKIIGNFKGKRAKSESWEQDNKRVFLKRRAE